MQRPNPFYRFVRGRLEFKNGKIRAKAVGLDKPNIVTSLAGADCLIVLPGGEKVYEEGIQVRALLLDDQRGSSEWLAMSEVEEASK